MAKGKRKKQQQGKGKAGKGAAVLPNNGPRLSKSARRRLQRTGNSDRTYYFSSADEDFVQFQAQLKPLGLRLRDMRGDGNCLFRALSDQKFGTDAHHRRCRDDVVQYILAHEPDFAPFVVDDITFQEHVDDLKQNGTFGGNDSIVAFARLHNVSVVIHHLGQARWAVCGNQDGHRASSAILHVAYHNGEHYSSVRPLEEEDAADAPIDFPLADVFRIPVAGSADASNAKGAAPGAKKAVSRKERKRQQRKLAFDSQCQTMAAEAAPAAAAADADGNTPGTEPNGADAAAGADPNVLLESEQAVADATGCWDLERVRSALAENALDPDATIAYLLQLLCLEADAKPAPAPPPRPTAAVPVANTAKAAPPTYPEDPTAAAEDPAAADKAPPAAKDTRIRIAVRDRQTAPRLSNKLRKQAAKAARKQNRLAEKRDSAKRRADSSAAVAAGADVGTLGI